VFCVPRRQSDWSAPVVSTDRNPIDYDPASVLDHYLEVLQSDLNLSQEKLSGAFFKSAHGKKAKVFRNAPMGKNFIAKVGYDFAVELVLPSPHSFTGHCWRRSCGTNASDAGVNVTTLMAQMGWTTPKTAIGYVRKSRMTSYQMSMFLSNVQRQNKDLDQVLGKVKQVPKRSSSSKLSLPASSSAQAERTDFDPGMASRFAVNLASARKSESSARTMEELKLESERDEVLSSIFESEKAEKKVNSEASIGSHDVPTGSGGGDCDLGGGGGGADHGIVGREVGVVGGVGIDPRVGLVLNSIRHQGALHVHFHFNNQ